MQGMRARNALDVGNKWEWITHVVAVYVAAIRGHAESGTLPRASGNDCYGISLSNFGETGNSAV